MPNSTRSFEIPNTKFFEINLPVGVKVEGVGLYPHNEKEVPKLIVTGSFSNKRREDRTFCIPNKGYIDRRYKLSAPIPMSKKYYKDSGIREILKFPSV